MFGTEVGDSEGAGIRTVQEDDREGIGIYVSNIVMSSECFIRNTIERS
jgi:hypothetical protein